MERILHLAKKFAPPPFWTPAVYYHINKNRPLDPILARWIHSIASHPIFPRYILFVSSYLRQSHSTVLFHWSFTTKIYAFLICPMWCDCVSPNKFPVHLKKSNGFEYIAANRTIVSVDLPIPNLIEIHSVISEIKYANWHDLPIVLSFYVFSKKLYLKQLLRFTFYTKLILKKLHF